MNIGDPLPNLTLPDSNGQQIQLQDLKGALVIYFYPKDETPGCTLEACEFRDRTDDFKALGATIIGISRDSVDSHRRFAKNHQLAFPLLSDKEGEAEKAFGVARNFLGLVAGRTTFVFSKEKKLIFKFDSQLQFKRHVAEALHALKQL